MFFAGKSTDSIQDRTMSIYYGSDFCNVQVINFVSVSENAADIIKVKILSVEDLFYFMFNFRHGPNICLNASTINECKTYHLGKI